MEDVSRLDNLIDFAYSITKNDIDNGISNFLSFSLYSTIGSPLVMLQTGGSSFGYHFAEAIGFKLFSLAATPAIFQAVSAYTEALQSFHEPSSWTNFSWFNTTAYTETVSDNFEKLTASNLIMTGMFSAISSEIRNEVYHQFDLTASSQHCLFKYVINDYFKSWIKKELYNTLTDLTQSSDEFMKQIIPAEDIFESPPLFDTTYHSGPLDGVMRESLVDKSFEPICRVRENELPVTTHEIV